MSRPRSVPLANHPVLFHYDAGDKVEQIVDPALTVVVEERRDGHQQLRRELVNAAVVGVGHRFASTASNRVGCDDSASAAARNEVAVWK